MQGPDPRNSVTVGTNDIYKPKKKIRPDTSINHQLIN